MAGFCQLALLVLTVFACNCLCRTWPDIRFENLKAAEWELPVVVGVPSLDFSNNFMIPSKFDPQQIIVATGWGYNDNRGEGCISVFSLRNRTKPAKNLAGNCTRRLSPEAPIRGEYRNGHRGYAQLRMPDHGQFTKDSKYLLFVDNMSCARRVIMSSLYVDTIIGRGTCGQGTLDGLPDYGTGGWVIGMVYLDEKDFWVFFVKQGMYIYSWNGGNRRKIADPAMMSGFPSSVSGQLTRSAHNNFLVFQKVQFGVTTYDFTNINITHGGWSPTQLSGLTKLFSCRPGSADNNAVHKMTNVVMSGGHGLVSQHPHYPELLMVTDWDIGSIYIANTDTGAVTRYCKKATGASMVLGQDMNACAFKFLRGSRWIGGESLSALIVDRFAWRIHELVFINQGRSQFNQKCEECRDGSHCSDTRSGNVKCMCTIGHKGPTCDIPVCQNIVCSSHGTCVADETNSPSCKCEYWWRGDWCQVRRNLALKFHGIKELEYGNTPAIMAANISEGFLMQKQNDPAVLIVAFRAITNSVKEGAIGYFRLGHMDNFVVLVGNLNRNRGPSSFNNGIGSSAHVVAPLYGYQQLGGEYLHFVDFYSCARRLKLDTRQVTTFIGAGRCGNGTLDMTHYGTQRLVSGMTMLELTNRHFFAFSGPFGVWLYPWSGQGQHVRQAISPTQASFYASEWSLKGMLVKKQYHNNPHVLHNTHQGLATYNFSWIAIQLPRQPIVTRIASYKPWPALHNILLPNTYKDSEANLNYDPKQRGALPWDASSMDVNPLYRNIVLFADNHLGTLKLFNKSDGNMQNICKKGTTIQMTNHQSTCTWVDLRYAMWLTATTALAVDYSAYGKIFIITFRHGQYTCNWLALTCSHHGICIDHDYGIPTCLCDDDWTGQWCTQSRPRTAPVFPTEEDTAGHLMSVGTSASGDFSTFVFVASLTISYHHLSEY